jgi:phosphoribosylaminoimidazolecarboxamide formyltransferase/IMP cyclohydrolase
MHSTQQSKGDLQEITQEDNNMRTVLVSVSDKSGLTEFLKKLEKFDSLRIIGTSSTTAFLLENGFQCMKVEELTKFPEILGGRVKTLHPKVLAGVLSRPSKEDRSCLQELDILEIDYVVCNLYPFEKKLQERLPESEMIEHIDVGGVTLLRAAAKNYERVAIISDPAQYDFVIEQMEAASGQLTSEDRRRLAFAAFKRTADYDRAIAIYLGRLAEGEAQREHDLPADLTLNLSVHQSLRYGENPHQSAAWYAPPAVNSAAAQSFPPFEQLQGKELSFNNIVDVYALLRILRELQSSKQNGVCIIKHNNPCGVAVDDDLSRAFERAYDCDPVSAFGGIYGFTRPIDAKLAERIVRDFVEIVAAPEFTPDAMPHFAKKKNLRVLKLTGNALAEPAIDTLQFKDLADFGFLVSRDNEPPARAESFKTVTKTQLDPSYLQDVQFAWSVVKHLTSNAIFVARHGVSLGIGIGQTNRVGSVKIALTQAGEKARGAVLSSDAFFPNIDNIQAAAQAGIKVIVQPGGSIKDDEVIAECDRQGINMLFTGQRRFKH